MPEVNHFLSMNSFGFGPVKVQLSAAIEEEPARLYLQRRRIIVIYAVLSNYVVQNRVLRANEPKSGQMYQVSRWKTRLDTDKQIFGQMRLLW